MKHVNREAAEAAVKQTSARLERISDLWDERKREPWRDVIHVLALHAGKMGQDELSDQIHDFLIGYTNPAPAPEETDEVAE